MWLEIVKTNNNPHVIGKLFLDCIKEQRGCPAVLRTDRGTEKGILASAQCFLRRHHADGRRSVNAHRYGSSHTNQRIEAWWAMLRRSWSSWWINFFKDLVATGVLDTSGTLHLECLWGSMFLASSSRRWPTKCKRPSLWVTPYQSTD